VSEYVLTFQTRTVERQCNSLDIFLLYSQYGQTKDGSVCILSGYCVHE
jgi:hypothetical protein